MSTIVKDICTAIKNTIANELGIDYKELPFTIDVTLNSLKTSIKRYGVRPLALSSDTGEIGVTRALTVSQDFEILLVDNYINQLNDTKQKETALNLYEKTYIIYNKLFLSKLGMYNNIMNINKLAISEPEYLDEENVIVLRSQLTVIYRQAIV